MTSQKRNAHPSQDSKSWLYETTEGVVIRLKIQAQASRTQIVGLYGEEQDRLKIKVAAAPIDQAANEELLSFLRKNLKIPSRNLTLIRGQLSPLKDILCQGVTLEGVEQVLLKKSGRD